MANAHRWRPYVLFAAAMIVLASAQICRRQSAEKTTREHTYKDCVELAGKLNAASVSQLPKTPSRLLPALRSVIAQLNVQGYALSKIPPQKYSAKNARIWDALHQIGKDLSTVTAGKDPSAQRVGRFVRGYASTVGGIQGYSINIPEEYDDSRSFPLVVSLHGFGNSDRWNISRAPKHPEVVTVAPRGFGSTDYKFIGEQDVLDVIEDVKRHYNIDADRVYLAGASMGGTGCWTVAAHHPDIFAAIAPIMGNTDFQMLQNPKSTASDLQKMLHFQRAATSATSFAENLIDIPAYCLHGSDDRIVFAAHSQVMVKLLKAAGAKQVVYWEFPGFRPGGFPSSFTREQFNWMLSKRRVREPGHVVYRTASLRHPGAYWLTILRRPNPVAFSRIEGKITGDAAAEITTSNVSRFQLKTPERLLAAESLTITVDATVAYKGKPEPALVFELHPGGWRQSKSPDESIAKRPGMSGPIEGAFLSSFMIVHGTGNEMRTGAVAELAVRWRQADVVVKDARAVTAADIAKYNLILMGDPKTNRLMAEVMAKLPIRIEGNTVVCGDRSYEGEDLALKMCYPNPLNPRRYVVVLASTGYNGMFGINTRFGNWFHWVVYNNRDWFDYVIFDDGSFGPDTFVEVGFFDSEWKLSDRFRWNRSAETAGRRRNVPALPSILEAPDEFFLSELQPILLITERGPISFDQQPDGSLIGEGEHGRRGLMMPTPATITYQLAGQAKEMTFTPWVPEAPSTSTVRPPAVKFIIAGDGRRLYASGAIKPGQAAEQAVVLLGGVKQVSLTVSRAAGAGWIYLPAAWLDPLIRKDSQRPAAEGHSEATSHGSDAGTDPRNGPAGD